MAYEWFLAEIVMKITVAGDPRIVVHQNLTLIRATSGGEAYEKAIELGKAGETHYDNPNGQAVQISFEGLSDLIPLYEELRDGAELTFRSKVVLSEKEIRSLVLTRDRLPVFLPPKRADGPDYASGEVIAEVERRFRVKRPEKDPRN